MLSGSSWNSIRNIKIAADSGPYPHSIWTSDLKCTSRALGKRRRVDGFTSDLRGPVDFHFRFRVPVRLEFTHSLTRGVRWQIGC